MLLQNAVGHSMKGGRGSCRSDQPALNKRKVDFRMSTHKIAADYDARKTQDIVHEREAVERLKSAIATIKSDMHWYWRYGDGCGGYVLALLEQAARENGETWPFDLDKSKAPKKAKISRSLSRRVMERDKYRCINCGTHIDLCCDHVLPESKGGKTTFENLQTMCRSCNSRKGNRI